MIDKVSMRKSADKRNLFDQNEIFLVDDRTACKIEIVYLWLFAGNDTE